jgi:beta-galactosidase
VCRKRGACGTHFEWDDVEVRYNVLYAEGRVGGKVVATDALVLKNLPVAPHRAELNGADLQLTAPAKGWNYLYRVNCGGPEFTDTHGHRWQADRDYAPGGVWGSLSWAAEYGDVPARFGSQRETFDAIAGTPDEALFQTFRYGREKLRYAFAVPDGDYRIELFFIEPWYGRGGGDCTGWRLFDVAVNGETKLRDVDLWRETGHARALGKAVSAKARDGWLEISFPRVPSNQAVISAIAIATKDPRAKVPEKAPPAPAFGGRLPTPSANTANTAPEATPEVVQGELLPATRARLSGATQEGGQALLTTENASLTWDIFVGLGGAHEMQVRYVNDGAAPLPVELKVVAPDGTLIDSKTWDLPPTEGTGVSGPPGGLGFNAGTYTATLTLKRAGVLKIESLLVN